VDLKLLLDENISPKVGEQLRTDGVDAVGVRDRGLLQAEDRAVLERAFAEERVLVTKNIGHFEKLANAREIHAGIVFLEDAAMNRDEQLRVIRLVVNHLKNEPDLVNRILRVSTDGTMNFEELPRP
jgi:predicted nuclease of predicted toxin-antitoxin system